MRFLDKKTFNERSSSNLKKAEQATIFSTPARPNLRPYNLSKIDYPQDPESFQKVEVSQLWQSEQAYLIQSQGRRSDFKDEANIFGLDDTRGLASHQLANIVALALASLQSQIIQEKITYSEASSSEDSLVSNGSWSGATFTGSLQYRHEGRINILTANLGDSSSILFQYDHKNKKYALGRALNWLHSPTDLLEQERIIHSGGFIENARVANQLAVSRSLGDFQIRGVGDEPDFSLVSIPEGEKAFLLHVCDGVTDVLSIADLTFIANNFPEFSEDYSAFIKKHTKKKHLQEASRTKWMKRLKEQEALLAEYISQNNSTEEIRERLERSQSKLKKITAYFESEEYGQFLIIKILQTLKNDLTYNYEQRFLAEIIKEVAYRLGSEDNLSVVQVPVSPHIIAKNEINKRPTPAVFSFLVDAHGPAGKELAQFIKQQMQPNLKNALKLAYPLSETVETLRQKAKYNKAHELTITGVTSAQRVYHRDLVNCIQPRKHLLGSELQVIPGQSLNIVTQDPAKHLAYFQDIQDIKQLIQTGNDIRIPQAERLNKVVEFKQTRTYPRSRRPSHTYSPTLEILRHPWVRALFYISMGVGGAIVGSVAGFWMMAILAGFLGPVGVFGGTWIAAKSVLLGYSLATATVTALGSCVGSMVAVHHTQKFFKENMPPARISEGRQFREAIDDVAKGLGTGIQARKIIRV